MKVAITATAPTLEAELDPRFGRCAWFLFVETDDLSFEATENPNQALGGGAGIQSAQLVAGRGVSAVLTGSCGPNAFQTLAAAGIEVVVGCSGKVSSVLEAFRRGELGGAKGPNVGEHAGLSSSGPGNEEAAAAAASRIVGPAGVGRPGGRGMGGGGGCGQGGGGRGGGRGRGGGGGGGGRGGGGGGRGQGGGGGGRGRGMGTR